LFVVTLDTGWEMERKDESRRKRRQERKRDRIGKAKRRRKGEEEEEDGKQCWHERKHRLGGEGFEEWKGG